MGIGGLHSTESNRALHSDDDSVLVDVDVASYYPRIILGSGLYPKALGKAFMEVFTIVKIVDDQASRTYKSAEAADEFRRGPISRSGSSTRLCEAIDEAGGRGG
jgi:hypothetical protein